MALTWINHLSTAVGTLVFIVTVLITSITLIRNPKEKLNWLFASSFIFMGISYIFLAIGAYTNPEENPFLMVLFTKFYAFFLFYGIILLMLSAIAFNYSIRFTLKPVVLIPTFLVVAIITGLLFGLNDIDGVFYSIRANPDGSVDTQTSLLYSAIFYPTTLTAIALIFIFFIKAYRQTESVAIKNTIKLFLSGILICVLSLVPNILSNVLAQYMENAQILNGIEFIIVAIGFAVLLSGFILRTRENITAKAEDGIAS